MEQIEMPQPEVELALACGHSAGNHCIWLGNEITDRSGTWGLWNHCNWDGTGGGHSSSSNIDEG